MAIAAPSALGGVVRNAPAPRRGMIGERWYVPYLLILPHFVFFSLFIGWPFVLGIWISLHDFDFLREEQPFVGLHNFLILFTPGSIHFSRFWGSLWNTVIFVAGIPNIPTELYEASAVDGANPWKQLWRITLPSLRPVLLLVVNLQIIASFNLFGQPQLMTGGGPPPNETTPVMFYIYN